MEGFRREEDDQLPGLKGPPERPQLHGSPCPGNSSSRAPSRSPSQALGPKLPDQSDTRFGAAFRGRAGGSQERPT